MNENDLINALKFIQQRVELFANHSHAKCGGLHRQSINFQTRALENHEFVHFDGINLSMSDIVNMDVQKLTNEADEFFLKNQASKEKADYARYLTLKAKFECTN